MILLSPRNGSIVQNKDFIGVREKTVVIPIPLPVELGPNRVTNYASLLS